MYPAFESDLTEADQRRVGLSFLDPTRLIVLQALLLVCVFDPAGAVFDAKYALFVLWILFSITATVAGLQPMPEWLLTGYTGFFALFLPFYGLLIGLVRGGLDEAFIDNSYITSGAFFTFALFLTDRHWLARALSATLLALRLLTIVIVGLTLLDFFGRIGALGSWLNENKIAVIASRNYGGVDFPYVYFVTSPMLVLLLASDTWTIAVRFQWRRLALLGLTVLALFLSGTRANMVMALIGPGVVLLWRRLGGVSSALTVAAASGCAALLLFNAGSLVLEDMLSVDETNNAVKIGYLTYFWHVFNDPLTLLFGQGFNAHAWSADLRDMLPEGSSITELTYLDLLRVFGVVGAAPTVVLLAFLAFSRRSYLSSYPFVGAAIFLYALLSFGNPYLFSSNGMALIGIAAAVMAAADGIQRIER
jgi:hypothetical protein